MIDRVRYFLGVAVVVVVPLGLLYWLVIHHWVRWWRIWGPARTFLVVLPVLTALGVSLYAMHELGYLMLLLEERELLDRFGKAYEDYRRDVPQLVPYLRKRTDKPPDTRRNN